MFERKYARTYLGDPESRDAVALRKQIARGAREALEEQYWDMLERTVQSRPTEARLGGDPSVHNKVRAFLAVRFYRNGEWEDRIELVAGQPIWAKLYFLVRTGHVQEALQEALQNQQIIEHREASFFSHFKTWIESPERKYVFIVVSRLICTQWPFLGFRKRIGITYRQYTMHTCCIHQLLTLSSWRCTNSWANLSPREGMFLKSPRPPKIGYGCSWQWCVESLRHYQNSTSSRRSMRTKMVVFEHSPRSCSGTANVISMDLLTNPEGKFGLVCYSCVDNSSA